jgi:hypothetical protein
MFKQAFGLRKGSTASVKIIRDVTLSNDDALTPRPRKSLEHDKVDYDGGIDPSSLPNDRTAEETTEVLNIQKEDKSGLFICRLFLNKYLLFCPLRILQAIRI